MGRARLVSVVEHSEELRKFQNKVDEQEESVQVAPEEEWLEDLIQKLRSKVQSAQQIREGLRKAIQSKLSEADDISSDCGVRQALGALAQSLLTLLASAAGSEEESRWIVDHLIDGRPGLKLFEQVPGPPTSSPSTEPSPGASTPSGSEPLEGDGPASGDGQAHLGSPASGEGGMQKWRDSQKWRFEYDDAGLLPARRIERLEKLNEILSQIKLNFENGPLSAKAFRGIVFVRSRQSACEILDRIKGDPYLNAFFHASPFVGQVCMTIREQYDATLRFHTGECNLLVATSVAEEGLDFPACNIVVRYSSATSHTALIQSRGRVRSEQGTMYILTRRPPSVECSTFRRSQRFETHAKAAAAKLAVK